MRTMKRARAAASGLRRLGLSIAALVGVAVFLSTLAPNSATVHVMPFQDLSSQSTNLGSSRENAQGSRLQELPNWEPVTIPLHDVPAFSAVPLLFPEYVPDGWKNDGTAIARAFDLWGDERTDIHRVSIAWSPSTGRQQADPDGHGLRILTLEQSETSELPDEITAWDSVTLSNGQVAYISGGMDTHGQPGGRLTWADEDRYILLEVAGLGLDELVRIANSLRPIGSVPQ